MASHFVIDGNAFYEVDDECMRQREESLKKEEEKDREDKKQKEVAKNVRGKL